MDEKGRALTTLVEPPILQLGEYDMAVLQTVAQDNRMTERIANAATYLCRLLVCAREVLITGLFYQEQVKTDGAAFAMDDSSALQLIHETRQLGNVEHWVVLERQEGTCFFYDSLQSYKMLDDLKSTIWHITGTLRS